MQRKGGIERFLEKKILKLAITAAKESGEARKIVRNKKKLHREDKIFCAIFEGSKAIE